MSAHSHLPSGMAAASFEAGVLNSDAGIAAQSSTVEGTRWVMIGDTVILILTIIGSIFILGGMGINEYKRRASTVRMRLVQSLVFSDLALGIVGVIGCGLALDGKPLHLYTRQCDAIGIILIAIIFSQHLWTLTLAWGTFMILVHPLHRATSWIEKNWLWLWPMVWIPSFGISLAGHFAYGYQPSGGICYYKTGLFSELVQFMPRGIVFVSIALLYGRLYVFLRRPDKIRTGFSNSPVNTSSYTKAKGSFGFSRGSRATKPQQQANGLRGLFGKQQKTIILHSSGGQASGASSPPPPAVVEKRTKSPLSVLSPRPRPADPDLPPWERIDLPEFQVDGQRYGGATATAERRDWGEWRGFGGRKRVSSSVPPTLPSLTSSAPRLGGATLGPSTPQVSPTDASLGDQKSLSSPTSTLVDGRLVGPDGKPLPSPTQALFEKQLTAAGSDASGSRSGSETCTEDKQEVVAGDEDRSGASSMHTAHTSDERVGEIDTAFTFGGILDATGRVMTPTSSTISVTAPSPTPTAPTGLPFMSSIPPSFQFTPDGFNPNVRRGSLPNPERHLESPLAPPLRRPSFIPPHMLPRPATPRSILHEPVPTPHGSLRHFPRGSVSGSLQFQETQSQISDPEKGGIEPDLDAEDDDDKGEIVRPGDDDDERWDIMRMLNDAPDSRNDPFVVTNGSDKVEYVQESMASYLNRKTALLMLWFPLGYVLLFSVSTIRIIYDFVGTPPRSLRAISRWMIFGQGLLNCVIYGVVEWHTKRVVRKRVRKGTFSPHTSAGRSGGSRTGRSGGGLGSAIRGLGRWHGNSAPGVHPSASFPQTASQGYGQTASQIERRAAGSPSVSFVDPEMSILQRLEPDPTVTVEEHEDEYAESRSVHKDEK